MASLADCASGHRDLCVECSKKGVETTPKALIIYLEETREKNLRPGTENNTNMKIKF